jgi:hypothetical protein
MYLDEEEQQQDMQESLHTRVGEAQRRAKRLRIAIFYTRLYNRSLRIGLAVISPDAANLNLPVTRSIRAAEAALNTWYDQANLAA